MQHAFDFDSAQTLAEFFEAHDLQGRQRRVNVVKNYAALTDEEGNLLTDENGQVQKDLDRSFMVLLVNQEWNESQNRPTEWAGFVLSKTLSDQGITLSIEWVKEHKEDLMLVRADDLKYGICYLQSKSIAFDDL